MQTIARHEVDQPPVLRICIADHGMLTSDQAGRLLNSWLDHVGNLVARAYRIGADHYIEIVGLASYQFDDLSPIVYAYPESGITAEQIQDGFERAVLPLVLQQRRFQTLHASAIVVSDAVVAFCGPQKSGKSTLAYGFHHLGRYRLWSDDVVAMTNSNNVIRTFSLPFRMSLRHESSQFFSVDDIPPQSPASVASEQRRLRALCVLCQKTSDYGTSPPVIERLYGHGALTSVLSNAYLLDPHNAETKRAMVTHYLSLVNHIPVYLAQYPAGLANLSRLMEVIESTVWA